MKRLFLICTVVTLLLVSRRAPAAYSTEEASGQIFQDDGQTLSLFAVVPDQDISGNAAVAIIFVYKNMTSDLRAPASLYSVELYQDGVELQTAMTDNEITLRRVADGMAKICDGGEVIYEYLMSLNDPAAQVEVHISDLSGNQDDVSFSVDPTIRLYGKDILSSDPIDWENEYRNLYFDYQNLWNRYTNLLNQ
jgi:hypothetical protein